MLWLVHGDPVEQYRRWAAEAAADEQAVALATATRAGAPSVRMVLLKQADERGFAFFTNYESRKGRELRENPRAAILVHWPGRQVRVEGPVERLPEDESDAYWATRPPRSRAAAFSSRQSQVLESREELERAVAEAERLDPPRPAYWGGFRLVPETWEFWQHGDDRLHDRCRYRRDGGDWISERLSP
jgi:pyridoxamine 5'-phosphate oxidase